jgi:hypothetical protein
MGQAELQAARQRFPDEDLDMALKIAWEMLLAADHPAAAPERAKHARRLIAEAIVGAAGDATDIDGLWLAGVDAFRYQPFPQRGATSPDRRHQKGFAVQLRRPNYVEHIRQWIGLRLTRRADAHPISPNPWPHDAWPVYHAR